MQDKHVYPLCGVDQVEQSQQGDGDSHSRPVHHGNQRLREVDVGLHILPVRRERKTTEEENEQWRVEFEFQTV